jgi:hypothetical protein
MSEEKKEQKRAAVKARKSEAQLAKGARRKQRRQEVQAYGNRPIRRTGHGPGISITVQLPALKRPTPQKLTAKVPGSAAPRKKRVFWPVLAVPVILFIAFVVFAGPDKHTKKAPAAPVAAADRTEPDYKPLLPSADAASTPSYDAKRNLVTYTATFSGARLTISQQALPSNFTKDPTAVMKAADSIKATDHIETAKGILYVGTNEAAGDQMALFADKTVLVFVHSDRRLDEASWKAFIELLQAKSWQDLG